MKPITHHRFQDSCMLHVQLPLMLGIFCGTVAYVSIFRVSDRLPEQLAQIQRDHRPPTAAKVAEVPDLRGPRVEPTRAPKEDASASRCQYMKKRFKTENPAVVEFPMADDCDRWYKMAGEVRRCTVEYLTNVGDQDGLDTWKRLPKASNCCSSGMYDMLSVTPLTQGPDTKYVVFPSSPTLPCFALSIGLLADLSTARKLHEVLPQCEQYAAESNRKVSPLGTPVIPR